MIWQAGKRRKAQCLEGASASEFIAYDSASLHQQGSNADTHHQETHSGKGGRFSGHYLKSRPPPQGLQWYSINNKNILYQNQVHSHRGVD